MTTMQHLYQKPQLVYRAGTIPYFIDPETNQIQMMFMQPAEQPFDIDRNFQLAKGRVEEGESHFDAAIREAKEELGMFFGNVSLTEEVGVFMGRTTVYVARIKDKDMFGIPSSETSDVAWMTLREFMEEGRILHRPVIQAAYRIICKLEERDINKELEQLEGMDID